jgi:hypothetical protein
MAANVDTPETGPDEQRDREPAHYMLAFAIGALVGIGFAAIWIPEQRRRRLPALIGDRYRRVRDAGASALDEIRSAGGEAIGEFRQELGSSLEAAREEMAEMARKQLKQARGTLRREYRKLRR